MTMMMEDVNIEMGVPMPPQEVQKEESNKKAAIPESVAVLPFEVEESPSNICDDHTDNETEQQGRQAAPHNNWKVQSILVDWIVSLLIGALVVSFWRGGWTLMDQWDCGQSDSASLVAGDTFCGAANIRSEHRRDSAIRSYWIGLLWLLLSVCFMWSGAWEQSLTISRRSPTNLGQRYPLVADFQYYAAVFLRCFAVYGFGTAAIHVWRGIWYGLDYWVLYNDPVASWWTTTLVGIGGAFCICSGASLLAPPSIFLLDNSKRCDGPSTPPIGGTILTAFYDKITPATSSDDDDDKAPLHKAFYGIDIIGSFIVLPIFVLGFWRGFWGLLDHYLWGFAVDDKALNMSLLYSALISLGCFALASDDVVYFLPPFFHNNLTAKQIMTQLKTLILALGTVSYWRMIWYVWDAHLGGPTFASAMASHVLGVVGLICLGCFSSVAAPPSTIGVDVLDHPESKEDPLFHSLPLPAQESLFVLAIARQLNNNNTGNIRSSSRDHSKAIEETDNESSSGSDPHSIEEGRSPLSEVTV